MKSPYTENELSQADDDLAEIVFIKESLAAVFNRIALSISDGTFKCSKDALAEAALCADELVGELLCNDWHRLSEISGSLEWPVRIPSKLAAHRIIGGVS